MQPSYLPFHPSPVPPTTLCLSINRRSPHGNYAITLYTASPPAIKVLYDPSLNVCPLSLKGFDDAINGSVVTASFIAHVPIWIYRFYDLADAQWILGERPGTDLRSLRHLSERNAHAPLRQLERVWTLQAVNS